MGSQEIIIDVFYFLVASLTFVPLFKWFKLGAVLGYITAGILIGPMGLGLIYNSESISELSEFGIILLLFIVGLELSPIRLKTLRKSIILDGGMQMGLSTLIFAGLGAYLGLDTISAAIIGLALSLSSTAFVLSYLSESSQLTLSHGQTSLSVLLFQDIIIIPILAIIPLLSQGGSHTEELFTFSMIFSKFFLLSSLLIICVFILRPAISFVKKTQDPEIFLAACLFLVVGMAVGMDKVGLSKALGAFMAGVSLANSEVKKDIKNITLPFKGMLMGLFFMTLGMELKWDFLKENMGTISFICICIFVIKSSVLLVIGKLRNGSFRNGMKLGLLLSQSGEFGLVVLATALHAHLLESHLSKVLVSCITLTMLVAPLLARLTTTLNSSVKGNTDVPTPKLLQVPTKRDDSFSLNNSQSSHEELKKTA